jgi:Sulfotransferase family
MSDHARLLMLGAMYENGGNTTHRFFDGHPQMFVYPFESQLGTRLVNDALASMFPVKYRWPSFALDATAEQDYAAIIDEEVKVRARTPDVSKFRHRAFDFSDDERRDLFCRYVGDSQRSRAGNVMAFFRATFDAWKDLRRTGQESVYVGYSPVIVLDAEAILTDLPDGHFVHVVRNPWSAYADTKKRPVPLPLKEYVLGWTLNQYHALILRDRFPDRLHIVRVEDVMADPRTTLGNICRKLDLAASPSLGQPSWNGAPLREVYPWGTIRTPTPAANRATADQLTEAEKAEVRDRAWQYLDAFDYRGFLRS